MYESKRDKPIPGRVFAQRLLVHLGIAIGIIAFSIAIGMTGYICLEHLATTDAFLNTAMLLGGMGPVNPPVTESGKLFAGFFALYAGLVFIVTAALLFTPLLHRLMHRFHWDDK
jgi:flagellar biosynthesis protein FliR